MKRILLYILPFFVLVGCGRHSVDSRLAHVNELANRNETDSAMMVLSSIEKQSLNEYNRHYYDLMSVKTRDKAYQDITDDTVITDIIDYFDSNGNDYEKGEAYYYGGRVYREMGDAPQALDYFQKALDAFPEDEAMMKGKTASQMGQIFNSLYLFEQANTKYNEAIQLQLACNDTKGIVLNYHSLGENYLWLNKPDSAMYCYTEALKLIDEIDNNNVIKIEIHTSIIDLYIKQKDFDKALQGFKNIEPYLNENYISNYVLATALNIYLYNDDLVKAEIYSKKLIDSGTNYGEILGYRVLADIAKEKKEINKLYDYTVKFKESINESNSTASQNAVVHQNSFYNYALREKENLSLQGYKNKTKYLYIVSSLSLIVIVLILCSSYTYRNKTKLLSYIQEDKIKKIESELKKLEKSQISDFVQTEKISDEIRSEYLKLIEIKAPKEYILPENIITSDIYIKFKSAIKNTEIHIEEKDWDELEKIVILHYPKFKISLTLLYNSMSDYEFQICLLTKCKFGKKEIANLTYHSPSSVTNTRIRLYEKMFLKKGTASEMDYLINIL